MKKTIEQELYELDIPQLKQVYYVVNDDTKEQIKKLIRIKHNDKQFL